MKVGIIGCGTVSGIYAEAGKRFRNIEITACADLDYSRAQALAEKRLAGAALDVWEREPVAGDNPLLGMDKVIASPHAAFFSSSAVARVPRRCAEEVVRVLTGQRPLNAVNPELYAPGAVRRAR